MRGARTGFGLLLSRAASAGLLLVALATAAFALDFPQLTGRVVDNANLLDAGARAALTQSLADFETRTTDQLVVVTLPSLQGTSIEDYGYQLGRRWQIGQKDKNNGVLLIVAPNERKVRIEVGYGLEGTLTDAIANVIIQNSILPRFKAGDFPGGIKRGAEDIIQVLSGDAEEFKHRAAGNARGNADSLLDVLAGPAFPFVLFFALIIIFGVLNTIHAILVALGLAERRPKKGFWHWVASSSSGSYSGGSYSGGSSWSSGSSGGGFSGGGGSFGGGGSSGSW